MRRSFAPGASALVEKGGSIEGLAEAIRARRREGPLVDLTRENTAIVLDSTPTSSTRASGTRTCGSSRSTSCSTASRSGTTSTSARQFYERLAASKTLPTTSQPTPADFLACYEELRAAGFARIWSLHLTSKLSGTYESAVRAAEQLGGDVVRVVDTETASLACALLAEAIDRRLEQRNHATRRSRSSSRGSRTSTASSSRSTRSSTSRRAAGSARRRRSPDRSSTSSRSSRPRRRHRAGRPRARPAEGGRGVRELFEAETEDRDGLRLAIAHANAPEWVDVLTTMALEVRPRATVELVETLGAVVGAHAGPGAVGFFWFQD